jgi:hypothetical protein
MHTLYTRINTGILVFIALTGIVLVTMLATRAYGGPLDPPAAPAPTMKTLQQIEPRTPISSLPATISTAGSYYLTDNLTGALGITITASNVTLDLSGFRLEGTGSNDGIVTAVGMKNIIVRNGTVRNWSTGVRLLDSSGNLVEGIVADDNGSFGIDVGINDGAPNIVRDVIARANGIAQIRMAGGVLRDSAVAGGQYGILAREGSLVVNNSVSGATVHGIEADGSRIEANDVSGSTVGYYAGIVSPPGSSLFIGNGARSNGTNYDIGAGNSYGAILAPAGALPNSDPHANFSY